MTGVDGTAAGSLVEALAAEHAAIFGYGVVGAHLDRSGQNTARQAETAHRNRRDAVVARILAAEGTPPSAAPAYELPFEVEDRASALRLAIDLEEGTARAWRRALAGTADDDRKLALGGLVDCAVRATRWRRTAGVEPAVTPFPGAND
jgi:hypothetical protein